MAKSLSTLITWKSVTAIVAIVVIAIVIVQCIRSHDERVFRDQITFAFEMAKISVEYRVPGTTENFNCAPSEIVALRAWLLSTIRADDFVSWPNPQTTVFILSENGALRAEFQISEESGSVLNYSMVNWDGKLRKGKPFRFRRVSLEGDTDSSIHNERE